MNLFLHIGLPKTGTSYIQNIFWNKNNQKFLKVYYPKDTEKKFKFIPTAGNGLELFHGIKERDELFLKNYFKKIFQKNKNVLLSSEVFSTLNYDDILFFENTLKLNEINIKIIVFVRNLYSFYLSGYSQTIKRGGETKSFIKNAIEREPLLDKIFFFDKIGEVNVFEYDLLENILYPFYQLKLISQELLNNKEKKINKSLSLNQLIFFKFLNKFLSKTIVSIFADFVSIFNTKTLNLYDKEVEDYLLREYEELVLSFNVKFNTNVQISYDEKKNLNK